MFDIEYKGGNTIVLSTKKSVLVTDANRARLREPNYVIKDSIELATEPDFLTNSEDFKLNISYPGSYEVSDFSINGFPETRHLDSDGSKNSVIYSIEIQGVRLAVLGNIAPDLADDQLENLGIVDILIIPVGGNGYTLDATAAANIARRSEAKVVIPVHYSNDGMSYEVNQDNVELFISELGVESEKTTKYKVKSASSLPDKQSIVIIEKTK